MADKLVDYIKKQVKAGNSVDTVRNSLIKYGHNPAAVDAAIRKSKSKLLWFVIIGVVLVVLVLWFIFSSFDEVENIPFELEVSSVDTSVSAGGNINFKITVNYDSRLVYQIVDLYNNVISSEEDTASVGENSKSLKSPSLIGNYNLKIIAYYKTQTLMDSFDFEVKKKEVLDDVEVEEDIIEECPSSCDDSNQCTRDYCDIDTGYECRNLAISPCCGNKRCESGESSDNCNVDCVVVEAPADGEVMTLAYVKDLARSKAAQNPSSAADFCSGLEKESHKDNCYSVTAEVASDSTYCDPIISDSRRDNCYTDFALNGDYSVCTKITNTYLKDSCDALAEIYG